MATTRTCRKTTSRCTRPLSWNQSGSGREGGRGGGREEGRKGGREGGRGIPTTSSGTTIVSTRAAEVVTAEVVTSLATVIYIYIYIYIYIVVVATAAAAATPTSKLKAAR